MPVTVQFLQVGKIASILEYFGTVMKGMNTILKFYFCSLFHFPCESLLNGLKNEPIRRMLSDV